MNFVSVIIPNFNGKSLLEKILPLVLKAQVNKKNRIKEIIVVDDASIDESVEFIKKYKQIKLIIHKVNRGFASSVNTGVRASSGQLLCLLNNDVVPKANFLEKVLSHFDKKDVFGVSLHEKGFGWAKGVFQEGFIVHQPGQEDRSIHDTFWISGGSGVFKREYWMKLGGLDEKLFPPFYWEDVDIGYRALKRGWKLLWEPNSWVVHSHESTIGKLSKKYRNKIQERNQLLFIWKNLTSPLLFKKHLTGLTERLLKHPGYVVIVLMALMKLRKILQARKKEIKESKISDEAIFSKFNSFNL